MRIQQFLAFIGAASLSLSALAAAPAGDPSSSTVMVQGGKNVVHRLTPNEAEQMKGTFQLEDGRALRISNRSARLYAELDGKREELVPVGPEHFVGRDSGTRISFDQVPFAYEVVVSQELPDGSRITLAGR